MFTWIPSHIGIHETTVVDALDDPIFSCSIPYTDVKPFIMKYILKRWQDSWTQLLDKGIGIDNIPYIYPEDTYERGNPEHS
jgi:hypothetical protein